MLAKINTNYALIGWKGGIKRQKVQTCETGVTDSLLVYLTSYTPYPSVSCKIFEITRTIFSNSERSEHFLVTKCILTCSWRFLISFKLEQLEFKLEKIVGI